MSTMTRLEDYLENAPMKTKIALAAAGTLMAALVTSSVMAPPARAAELESGSRASSMQQTVTQYRSQTGMQPERPGSQSVSAARTAPVVDQASTPYKSDSIDYMLAIERHRPMPNVVLEDIKQLNKMNERTIVMLRDVNEIATRFHESRAWSGDMFTPEQKAKNIATALWLAQNRADNPDVQKLDGYIVKLRDDVPENRVINGIAADVNFKRETLRNAALELNALIAAVKDDRQDDIEKHRVMTVTILKDAGYALNVGTDWSIKAGKALEP